MSCRPGDLIDIWEGGEILSGVVLSEEKGRLRVAIEGGREIRIPASRVAHIAGRGGPVDARRAAEVASRHAEAAKRRAASVDIALLWELLVDAGGRHAVEELAGLAFGETAGVEASALFRRLTTEKTYFERHGDLWAARSRDAVLETQRRLEAVAEKERRREAFLGRVRRAWESWDPAVPVEHHPEDLLFRRKLIDCAVHGEEAPDRKEAIALLTDLGFTPATSLGAFDLLVRLRVFDPDENLDLHRFGLRSEFPAGVEEAARAAAGRAGAPGRRDLTALTCFTLDDEETVEIDDALSWEPAAGGAPGTERGEGSGGGTIGIHIAGPSAFIRPGDPVDEEALKRASTYYFPDRRLPMIPRAISEEAASLGPGATRPALSFLVRVDRGGKVEGTEIVASIVRSRARLTYDEADLVLAGASGGPVGSGGADPVIAAALRALEPIATALERERAAAGAVVVRAPELIVKVRPGGIVDLKKVEARGPSRLLVAEMMILANRIAASLCAGSGIPAIFRRQAPPERPPAPIPEGPYDPVAIRALRRSLRRGETSLAPGQHHALGLATYLQVTSPIRRYQDLAIQRQIEAHLAGSPLPYDAGAMARIAATTDEAERIARRAEASRKEYWILKHFTTLKGAEVEGAIVAAEPRRTEVELLDTLFTASIAPRPDHAPGKRLRLVVEESRPREGVLRLREIERS